MNASGNGTAPARSGQPVPVLVAWLSELVDESGKNAVTRISELRRRLHAPELRWECAGFGETVLLWTEAANRLDLSLANRGGLWANMTGGMDRRLQQFNAAVEQVARAAALVRAELPLFEAACRSQQSSRKSLVELDFERKALLDELLPATGWLAEVAEAMAKTSEAHAANLTWSSAAERAKYLPREIKRLHVVADTAHVASEMGLEILNRRGDALKSVHSILGNFEVTWMSRVPSLAHKLPAAQLTARSTIDVADIHQHLVQQLDALSELLHELDDSAAQLDTKLWELAELVG